MVYRAIGIMSGSSLDGLDIVFAEFQEQAGQWQYEIKAAACYPYNTEWIDKLTSAIELDARNYQLLHTSYGHYIGKRVSQFIEDNQLQYKIGLVSSHGHTTFHMPRQQMTAQLGDGAAIASELKLPVVTDLRAMDLAFGGQGAPIVPIGEKHLLGDYNYFLNLGGIANISLNDPGGYMAFDICAANRVLNMLAKQVGMEYDEGGKLASTGVVNDKLLDQLNVLEYYKQPYPKSLANDFGTDQVYPIIVQAGISSPDALRTYTEHIAIQIKESIVESRLRGFRPEEGTKIKPQTSNLKLQTSNLKPQTSNLKPQTSNLSEGVRSPSDKLLVTGGGALNEFLIERLSSLLQELNISVVVPDQQLINYKEAMIMAFIGVLRWRQEYNVLSSVTGASRSSIGGALWTGEEA